MAATVESISTGKELKKAALIADTITSYLIQRTLAPPVSSDAGTTAGLYPTATCSRSHLAWDLDRLDLGKEKTPLINKRHFNVASSLSETIDFGAVFNSLCRLLLPHVTVAGVAHRIRWFVLDFNMVTVNNVSLSGQTYDFEVNVGQVATWDDFLIRYLLPLLPASAITAIDVFGNVYPLSVARATADVRVSGLTFAPGFVIPAFPGVLDCLAAAPGVSPLRTMLSTFDELLQQVCTLIDPKDVEKEVKANLGLFIGASLSGMFGMRFSNPDGTSGVQPITEFGFDNVTAGNSDVNAIFQLLRIRAFTVGRPVALAVTDPVWFVKGFVDKRARKIVESGLYNKVYSDDFKLIYKAFDSHMLGAVCQSEVNVFGGARVNACTSVARRLPTLDFVKKNLRLETNGTQNVVFEFEFADLGDNSRWDALETYSFFNLISTFGAVGAPFGSIRSIVGSTGNNLAIQRTAVYVGNYHGAPPMVGETLLVNPACNLDLLFAVAGAGKLAITVRGSDFNGRMRAPVLRVSDPEGAHLLADIFAYIKDLIRTK